MTLPRPAVSQPPSITNPNNGISFSAPDPTALSYARAVHFAQFADDFTKASRQVSDLMRQESALKQAVALRRVDLEVIEAKFVAEGMVNGGNAEQRKACLLLLCRDDEDYQVTWADQVVDEAELGRIEAQLELSRDARSISKRRMEMAIAVTHLEAASLK